MTTNFSAHYFHGKNQNYTSQRSKSTNTNEVTQKCFKHSLLRSVLQKPTVVPTTDTSIEVEAIKAKTTSSLINLHEIYFI